MRLIGVCCAALVGVALGDLVPLQTTPLALAAAVAATAASLAWRQLHVRYAAILACALALGGLRATCAARDHAFTEARLAPLYGRPVTLHVMILEPPSLSASGASARLMADAALPDSHAGGPQFDAEPTASTTRLRVIGALSLLSLEPGDGLTLRGKLIGPEGHGPPMLLYATPQGPPERARAWSPATAAARLRHHAEAAIHANMPAPEGALAAGILLGSSRGMPEDLRRQLQRSGLAHIIAIDGFKQLPLVAVIGAIARKAVGAYWARVPVLGGVVAYTLLTGAHPSAVRSGLMVGLASIAVLSGRAADSLTSLALATTLMLAVDPRLLFDLGLQLSVSATLGIILLWPRLRRRLRGVPHVVAEPAGLTLAVTLATLPIELAVFQSVSLVSPLAHIVAMPLLPIVFTAAAAVAITSPLAPAAAAATLLATPPTRVLGHATAFFGDLPGAALSTGRLPAAPAIALAVVLFAWAAWPLPELKPVRAALRLEPPLRLPAAALAACIAATAALLAIRPDGQLHVAYLPTARGEAVFVRGPTGRTVLLASGAVNATQLTSALAEHLRPWEHNLDVAIGLDQPASAAINVVAARYPPAGTPDTTRVPIGHGAAIDIYTDERAAYLTTATERLKLLPAPLRSAPTTSVATPGSPD